MKIIWSPDVILSSHNDGNYFTVKQTAKKPKIELLNNTNKTKDKLYKLLIMYDPDAVKPFIHWIVTLDGKDILPYYPPSPPVKTGLHRYMFCLIPKNTTINKNRIMSNEISTMINKENQKENKERNNCLFHFTSKYFVNGGTLKKYLKQLKNSTRNIKIKLNNKQIQKNKTTT
jgi:hypothetical protein